MLFFLVWLSASIDVGVSGFESLQTLWRSKRKCFFKTLNYVDECCGLINPLYAFVAAMHYIAQMPFTSKVD